MRYKLSRWMLLEKHSHACCIPLTKLTGSLKIYNQNISITKGEGALLGEKAGLWGAACGCASAAMPCARGNLWEAWTIPLGGTTGAGWFSPTPSGLVVQTQHSVPSGASLSQSLLSPKRRAVSVPAERRLWGWGQQGPFPSQAMGCAAWFGWGGCTGSSHTVTTKAAESRTGKLREISLEERLNPKMKDTVR